MAATYDDTFSSSWVQTWNDWISPRLLHTYMVVSLLEAGSTMNRCALALLSFVDESTPESDHDVNKHLFAFRQNAAEYR